MVWTSDVIDYLQLRKRELIDVVKLVDEIMFLEHLDIRVCAFYKLISGSVWKEAFIFDLITNAKYILVILILNQNISLIEGIHKALLGI